MATIAGDKRRDFEAVLDSLISRVEGMETSAVQKVLPVLSQAQKELEKDLKRWKAGEDGDAKFTTQRYRNALVNIRNTLETLKRTEPALMEGLRIGSRTAGQLATDLLEEELVSLGYHFDGTIQPMNIDVAAAMADEDKLLITRFKSSAKKYSGDVRKRLVQELAVSKIRGETINEMTERLEKSLPKVFEGMRNSARRVARTETMNAYNSYHLKGIDAVHEIDPEIQKRWDSKLDWRRCPHCESLDGKAVAPDTNFKADWETRNAAGKVRKHNATHEKPPAHPNCRCVVVAWRSDWEMPPRKYQGKPEPRREAPDAKEARKPPAPLYGKVWLPGESAQARKKRLDRERVAVWRAKKQGKPIPPIVKPPDAPPPPERRPPPRRPPKPPPPGPPAPPPGGPVTVRPPKKRPPGPKVPPKPPPAVPPHERKGALFGDVWLPGETAEARKKRLARERVAVWRAKKTGKPVPQVVKHPGAMKEPPTGKKPPRKPPKRKPPKKPPPKEPPAKKWLPNVPRSGSIVYRKDYKGGQHKVVRDQATMTFFVRARGTSRKYSGTSANDVASFWFTYTKTKPKKPPKKKPPKPKKEKKEKPRKWLARAPAAGLTVYNKKTGDEYKVVRLHEYLFYASGSPVDPIEYKGFDSASIKRFWAKYTKRKSKKKKEEERVGVKTRGVPVKLDKLAKNLDRVPSVTPTSRGDEDFTPAGERVRREMKKLTVGEFKLADAERYGVMQVYAVGRQRAGTLAYHQGNKVVMGKQSHDDATAFMRKVEAGEATVRVADAKGMKVLVHEQIHACGPGRGWRTYQGAGKVLEEVSTEISARRIMREKFKGVLVREWGSNKSMAAIFSPKKTGSYQTWIDKVQKSIKDALGVTDTEAWDLLDDASMAYKQTDKNLETASQVVDEFMKKIPRDMTTAQKRDLRRKIKAIRL